MHGNFNESDLEGVREDRIPDVILVRKGYRVSKRAAKRQWKLKQLEKTDNPDYEPTKAEEESKAFDFEMFMRCALRCAPRLRWRDSLTVH